MTNFVSNDDFANVTRLVQCDECGRLDEPEVMSADMICGTCTDMSHKAAAVDHLTHHLPTVYRHVRR